MRYKVLFVIGIVLFQFFEVKSQCYKFVSPKPLCTTVLENGDVEVSVSMGSIGAGVKAEMLDRVELEHSVNGQFFNAIASLQIGSKWPAPARLLHVGANAQSLTGIYRTVAYCDTVTKYALPTSGIVKSIKLDYIINIDKQVELSWNWDTVAENKLMIVNRKNYKAIKWDSVGSPTFNQGRMSFTDTSLKEADTVTYRVIFINLDNLCQGKTSEVSLIFQPNSKPSSIEEINLENVKVWPNPTEGAINISYSLSHSQNIALEVFNSYGQRIESINDNYVENSGQHEKTINLPSNLQPGLYFIRLTSPNFSEVIRFERL